MAKTLSEKPKYARLQEDLVRRIERGDLKPGDKLPTFAEMQSDFGATTTTVQRVYTALENEGFITRLNGRGTFVAEPKSRATGFIGFVGDDSQSLSVFPYWMHLMQSIREATEEHGRHLIMLRSDSPAATWKQVEGALITSPITREKGVDGPLVSLMARAEGLSCVLADEAQGLRDAIQHLLFLGHRRIGYLVADDLAHTPQANLRATTYLGALREAGIAPDLRWLRPMQNQDLHGDKLRGFLDKGRFMMAQWLQDGFRELDCTALLCHNDETALGALEVLREANIRVPQDLSLVGFDGTEVSTLASPKLTTVEVPLRKIGKIAVETLLAQIVGEPPLERPIVLPTKVRVRASTGPARL